jgi:tetratricopeptide (TPR) repeat protein
MKLHLAPAGTSIPEAVRALTDHLQRVPRWLLVFDNAEGHDELAGWLPEGPGQVLITSRNPHWAGVAAPVDVDVFTRAESVELLHAHLPALDDSDAGQLAEALGDLPLAVAQAADLLAETRLPVGTYLAELAAHAAELLREGRPAGGYPDPLAATITLTADRLAAADEAASILLFLCAWLGPEPIPADLFTARLDLLSSPLAEVARKPVAFGHTVAQLGRYGLARLAEAGPVLHRLVQAVLRHRDPDSDAHRDTIEHLLVAAQPDDGTDPRWWPRWSVLLPHLIAAGPATTTNSDPRETANAAVWHLMARGDARTALPLAEQLHHAWTDRHGPDDESTLAAATVLSAVYSELSRYQQARALDEETLNRSRRLLGDDHPDTLNTAHSLAVDLRQAGEYERARELDEDTLTRYRRVLGDDHPNTLNTANNREIRRAERGPKWQPWLAASPVTPYR